VEEAGVSANEVVDARQQEGLVPSSRAVTTMWPEVFPSAEVSSPVASTAPGFSTGRGAPDAVGVARVTAIAASFGGAGVHPTRPAIMASPASVARTREGPRDTAPPYLDKGRLSSAGVSRAGITRNVTLVGRDRNGTWADLPNAAPC
jgi:hypothetical protein